MVMMVMVVVAMLACQLPPSPLLLIRRATKSPPLLLVPRAERLATERQVLVLDDSCLYPRVLARVDLSRRRVEGAEVGDEVIRRFLRRHGCHVGMRMRLRALVRVRLARVLSREMLVRAVESEQDPAKGMWRG